MRDRKPAAARRRNGEEGSAIIVALIMMAVLMTVSLAATSVRVASARGADSRERQQDEYWGARSGASAVEASLRTDIPARYDADVASAKQMAGSRRLPSFDGQSVTASQSRPVMNTDGQRSSNDLASCTSLLGNINTWAEARLRIAEAYAQQLGHNARVAVLREAFRPQLAGGNAFAEGAYALEFYIDAAAGENGRVRPSGLVMLGPAVQGCNTTVTLNTSPSTITQGQTASLVVPYENATRIVVTESGGTVVANQVVTESGATQTISFNVTPATTTTYVATATNATGCRADSAPQTLTVTIPPPRIVLFEANPSCIILGDSSTLRWTIEGATSATIDGAPVNPSSGTMSVMPDVTTTYTLVATGGGCSPQQRQATVTIVVEDDPVPGSCPVINSLTAAPGCLVAGQSSQITWDAKDADTVTLNGSPVALSGSLNVTPAATTVYTLVAARAGCAPQQRQVMVEVATPPTINSFSAAPDTIQQGQSTSLQWNVSDAAGVTIDGVPVTPASGSLSVSPNATRTYTIVVTGAGCSPQQRQATVTITVNPCPTINFFSATPNSITAGGSSTLQWSVSDASAVTINGSPVSASGSMAVTPGATTNYRLIAQSASGGCDVEQTITVTVAACAAPEIVSFTANPSSVTEGAGGLVRLAWQINDPSGTGVTVSISPGGGGGLPQTGFVDISAPAATTEYTITATNGCGTSSTQRVTITVTTNPGPCKAPAPGDPLATVGGGGGGSFSVPGGAGAVSTNVRVTHVARFYPGGVMRFNVRLEISNRPGDTTPYTLVSTGPGGMTGRIGTITYTYTIGGCGFGICGVDFFDAGNNRIASAPFATIAQQGTSRVYTLVGDDGSFLTTPGVAMPYPTFDFTNDKLQILPFSVTAGNTAPFSTVTSPFNTFVSGSTNSFTCTVP